MSTLSILNLVLSALNAGFAYDAFKKGNKRSGYISLGISCLCLVSVLL